MKWYLCKSEIEKDDAGDVLIDLSKIFTIRSLKFAEGFMIVIDYTHRDSVVMKFSTEEKAREEMANILKELQPEKVSLVSEYKMMDKTQKEKDRDKEIVEKLLKIVNR